MPLYGLFGGFMKKRLMALSIATLIVSGCNETSFETETNVDSTTEQELSNTKDATSKSQSTDITLRSVKNDIKEGKVKGWSDDSSVQDRYLALLNYFRAKPIKCSDYKGYKGPQPAVSWSDELEAAAIDHSEDLLVHSQLGHRGSNGSTAAQRVKEHGFNGEYIGENVGYKSKSGIAYSGEEWIELFVGWIKSSDGHCSNIMSPEYNRFGMGEAKSVEGSTVTLFWTQDFGKE